MKLIKQSYEILGTPKSLEEAWSFVAKAARNCYQSEKTKLDESEEDFCRRVLLKHPEDLECDHMSPFEFGIIYLTISAYNYRLVDGKAMFDITSKYESNSYSRVIWDKHDTYYVTTNLRVIIENGWEEDLKYAGAPTKYHMLACCFRMITNRAIMCELTRHEAALSFTCESTRYCLYSNDKKFGNNMLFIPCGINLPAGNSYDLSMLDTAKEAEGLTEAQYRVLRNLCRCEEDYKYLTQVEHQSAQQAATILDNALKTTIMMCGYEDNLHHVFRLRAEECSGPVHPQMAELMKPLYDDYKQWLNNVRKV